MSEVATVYAQALYDLAAAENLTEAMLSELKVLDTAFTRDPDFLRLLTTPNLTKDERVGIVETSFRGKVQPYLLNFMKILTEKGYMRHFSACCAAFRAQYNREHGILPVQAVTAVPLTPAQSERLSAKLAQLTGKQIELQNTVDPACIGGVRLNYDGRQVDDTLRHRLDSIHGMLKNTVL